MKKLVNTREISIQTSDLGDHRILVEGSLIGHRFHPTRSEPPHPRTNNARGVDTEEAQNF